jgi:leucyl-tRNA synthetase
MKSAKMSKSLGNTVSPKEIIAQYGGDTARLFIMHGANPEKELEWSEAGCGSDFKVLQRVWSIITDNPKAMRSTPDIYDEYIRFRLHRMIRAVTESYEIMQIRDALNEIIGFIQVLRDYSEITPNQGLFEEAKEKVILMLAPVVPHIAEEMWELSGHKGFASLAKWPKFDKKQVNEAIEIHWNAYDGVVEDIENIKKLIQKESVDTIEIIIADEWKNEFVNTIQEWVKSGVNPGDLMKKAMVNVTWKPFGKQIKNYIDKISKNPGKFTVPFKNQVLEANFFTANIALLEKATSGKIIVTTEALAIDPKKINALPGKPAIIIR